jgi:four helix bundle protein
MNRVVRNNEVRISFSCKLLLDFELQAASFFKMKNYKKLKIWQKGMQLVYKTYELASQLPSEERFALRSQMTRAAVSIPSNIAEGCAKSGWREYKRYLEISLGSAYELKTHLLIVDKLQIADHSLAQEMLLEIDGEQRMISSFIRKLGTE